MVDCSFYKRAGPFKLDQLARSLDCNLSGDKNFEILDIGTLEDANKNEISFLSNKKYLNLLKSTNAGAIIVEKKFATDSNKNYLISDNPYHLLAKLACIMYPDSQYPNFFFSKNEQKKILINRSKFQIIL